MNDYSDTEGRPLGEGKAHPDAKVTAPMVLKACPYRGPREQHKNPMNLSALQQVMRHLKETKEGFATLRAWNRESGRRAEIIDAWRVVQMATMLPRYIRWSGPSSADRAIPAYMAVMAKSAFGLDTTLSFMAYLTKLPGTELVRPSAESILLVAEQSNHLIGPSEVCSAPATLILDVLRVILGETGQADAEQSQLAGDLSKARFVAYSLNQCNTEVLRALFVFIKRCGALALAALLEGLTARVPGDQPGTREQLGRAAAEPLFKPTFNGGGVAEDIAQALAPLSRQEQAEELRCFFDWFVDSKDEREPASQLAEDLLAAWGHASLAQVAPLAAQIRASSPGQWLDLEEATAAADLYLSYLLAERALIDGLAILEARCRQACQRTDDDLPPQAMTLERLLGNTPRQLFEALFAIRASVEPGATMVEAEAFSLRIIAP